MGEGDSFNQISRILGVAHSTISREINHHIPDNFHGIYCHCLISKQAKETCYNTKNLCISERTKMFIHECLSTHTSPNMVSQKLALKHDILLS
ncbi:helix-turn-helix domain-containing protein [Candidatus Enterovibrio escicola]|uniref:helix-turn-helix domain-containing protein n=1 Tax=Candidatus Enterovibrio escicola TaxID=1927127 RepID=UPI000BE22ECB